MDYRQVEFTSNAKTFQKLLKTRHSAVAKVLKKELVDIQETWVKTMKGSFKPFTMASAYHSPPAGLRARSGAMRSSVGGRVTGTTVNSLVAKMRVGSDRAGYAGIQEDGGIIKPRTKKYLTVPLRDAMTATGQIKAKAVIRGPFSGVSATTSSGKKSKRKVYMTGYGINTVVKSKKGNLLIVSRPIARMHKRTFAGGKQKGMLHGKVLYVLKKSVSIKPRLGARKKLDWILDKKRPHVANRLLAVLTVQGAGGGIRL
tara:strand:- start:91 stop:861 length:771 start_codon:yes stop_codon:yes gene_type:complete